MHDDTDICAGNHHGNARSREAHTRIRRHKSNLRERIYNEALERGEHGDIAENLYRPLGICDNTGTARCSELKRDGLLVVSGRVALTASGSNADVLVADIFIQE